MNKNFPDKLNIILFISALFLSLIIKFNPPIWTGFGDPYDYLHQSQESFSSKNLYLPEKQAQFYPRPFTVPLFYKIAGSDPETIIQMQKFMHAFSTFFLCYALLLFFKKNHVKIIFICLWYLLMSWWNILGWTHTLLSESLSMSFMFIWIASFLVFINFKSLFTIIAHILITILFSFTRDSWPYILIIFYLLYFIISIKWDRKILAGILSFLILSIGLFIVQQKSAETSQRYRLPITNNIVFRIMPNESYLKWFIDKGMPCKDSLIKNYSNLNDFKNIYPLYIDTSYSKLFKWVVNDGKKVYTKFLITHPSNFLLIHEKPKEIKRIFAYNIGYTGEIRGISLITDKIFPIFNLLIIITLNIFLVFLFFKEKILIWILPSVIITVFTFNAILLYLADTLEVERHLFITNIIIQFTGILLVSFILDSNLIKRKLFRRL